MYVVESASIYAMNSWNWKTTPLLSASILWGTTGTAQALAHLHAAPPAIGAARLLAGGLALWLVIAVRGRVALTELVAPGRRPWFLAAGLATAIYQAAFFAAVARTGVALGTLVALGSAPAFCGLLARKLAGERLPAAWTLSTACAVLGCALLLAPGGHTGADPRRWWRRHSPPARGRSCQEPARC